MGLENQEIISSDPAGTDGEGPADGGANPLGRDGGADGGAEREKPHGEGLADGGADPQGADGGADGSAK
ncbi:hypothetical protein [Actinoplanes sp. NPDC020271]|uniref:hypothetical protein n=1 Tax=Actinoplanes sp. NPDC020271 TaxID=3363896 RepID=UPI00379B25DB